MAGTQEAQVRGFKRAIAETEAAYASGKLIDARKRSFISQPKAIPGECEEPKPHLVLYGADATAARMKLYLSRKSRCERCKCVVVWSGDHGEDGYIGEWNHKRSKAGERCDCEENRELLCAPCHRREHADRSPWPERQALAD